MDAERRTGATSVMLQRRKKNNKDYWLGLIKGLWVGKYHLWHTQEMKNRK